MSLPVRDFNQEIELTRGCARALELAVDALLQNPRVVSDADDPKVCGVRDLVKVLADRLDDLVHMHGDELEETIRARKAA